MEEDKMIDQSVLAEDVASKIPYSFRDFFLVKPLDPVKVKKEFSTPVAKGEPKADENGIEAQDFDEVKTEVKEVDSDYRRGIVLKRPEYYATADDLGTEREIKVGDVVLFKDTAGSFFDLVKDSKLIRMYDIVAVER
jgi:co-chaperonin GroES (HSP10)